MNWWCIVWDMLDVFIRIKKNYDQKICMWVVFYYSEDLSCEKPAFLKKKKKRKKSSIWSFMHISLPNMVIIVVVFYFLALTNFCFLPVSCETKFISAVSVWLLHELPILNLYYGSLDCTNNSLILIGFLRLFEYLD